MNEEFKSAQAIVKAVKAKRVRAVEVCAHFIESIKKRDSAIRAFLNIGEERALEQAARVDAKIEKGEETGALAGLPIAIKDNISVAGDALTCGSKILENYKAPFDATVIAKLKANDAVLLGRTNLDEFAMGSSCEHSAFFPTRNPRDLSRTPGGSSGGSAAAVASLEAPASLGSDTAGSIRQPAALCGVVGFKPTYGKVSRYGLVAFASSLDQIGPITRNVLDTALIYDAIAGFDARDATSLKVEHKKIYPAISQNGSADSLKNLKFAIPKESLEAGLQSEIRENLQAVERFCKDSGASVEVVSLPTLKYAIAAYLIAASEASANLARFDGMRFGKREQAENLLETYLATRSAGFGEEVKRRILLGIFALRKGYAEKYYRQAAKVRTLLIRDFERVFASYDFLLLPTTPTTAFKLGEKIDNPLAMYLNDVCTAPANLAGVPAISIPTGEDKSALPIGTQLIAPALADERLLRIANIIFQNFALSDLRE